MLQHNLATAFVWDQLTACVSPVCNQPGPCCAAAGSHGRHEVCHVCAIVVRRMCCCCCTHKRPARVGTCAIPPAACNCSLVLLLCRVVQRAVKFVTFEASQLGAAVTEYVCKAKEEYYARKVSCLSMHSTLKSTAQHGTVGLHARLQGVVLLLRRHSSTCPTILPLAC